MASGGYAVVALGHASFALANAWPVVAMSRGVVDRPGWEEPIEGLAAGLFRRPSRPRKGDRPGAGHGLGRGGYRSVARRPGAVGCGVPLAVCRQPSPGPRRRLGRAGPGPGRPPRRTRLTPRLPTGRCGAGRRSTVPQAPCRRRAFWVGQLLVHPADPAGHGPAEPSRSDGYSRCCGSRSCSTPASTGRRRSRLPGRGHR